MPNKQPGSAYFLDDRKEAPVTHTFSVVVDNEPGVLARIAGLFSGRGYNIESLTVSETEHEKHLSRFTIVTTGTPQVLTQIKSQLERLVNVHRVVDLTVLGRPLERDRFAVDDERARVRRMDPGDRLDQGALARSVLADEGMRLTGEEIERDALDRDRRTESLGDVAQADAGRHRGVGRRGHPAATCRPTDAGLGARVTSGSAAAWRTSIPRAPRAAIITGGAPSSVLKIS